MEGSQREKCNYSPPFMGGARGWVFFFFFLFVSMALSASVKVANLSIEGREDQPLGIDVRVPSFGWQIIADADEHDVYQTRYHILVASSLDKLSENEADMWNTTVGGDVSQWVRYQGKKLKANGRYWWKVRVEYSCGKKKQWTEWSEPSAWSVGLLTDGAWQGYWIGMEHANPWDREDAHSRLSARYYRNVFNTKGKVRRATLHICGLGLYEAYLDGNRIGEDVLTPAPTDYTKSIIYNTYDVTKLLTPNANHLTPNTQHPTPNALHCLAVTVSNGRFYAPQQAYKLHKINTYGYPCLRANLIVEYENGTTEVLATNEKEWKINADGAIRSANEYDGEVYDARKEWKGWTLADYDDSSWAFAERTHVPRGTLTGNLTPSMKIVDTLHVKQIIKADNRLVIDFGQNFAGWAKVNLSSLHLQKGDTLRIRYAERLTGKESLYTANLRNAESTDYYISNGEDKDWWAPRFVTHGGRYVELSILSGPSPLSPLKGESRKDSKSPFKGDLEGLNDIVIGEVISDPMSRLGSFSCSNDMLNTLMRNAYWGILGNYKGMPIDCPQRDERMPWLGDRTMGCWGESYLLDNSTLYYKWLKDIVEAQRADGCIPDVAPTFWNYYSDNVTWPAVLITASDMLYRQFGDKRAIESFYPQMRKWLMHIWNDKRDSKTRLVVADKYADWCVTPESPELIHSQDSDRVTDGILIGSCYVYKLAGMMKEFARIIEPSVEMSRRGMSQDVLSADTILFSEMQNELREAINKQYLTIKEGTSPVTLYGVKSMPQHILYPDSIYYANNSLTANLLPLAFGIVPEKYEEAITSQILAKLLLNPANGHLCCGVIGVQWLLTELSKRGRTDVAYLLASRDDYPSWGYMAKNGATTIWELWNGDTANPAMNSGNHVMLLGDLVPWMFRELGGISSAEAGYKKVRLAPRFNLEELSQATAIYDSPYGKIVSSWNKTITHINWSVDIPCNTTAEVVLPSETKILGSGHYDFSVSIPSEALTDEFLYEKADFPSCHASTIVELKNGDLLAAYFGGSYEGCPDVCIYTQRKKLLKRDLKNGNVYEKGWSKPEKVAEGNGKACYNPVLFQVPNGDVILHYKIGKDVRDWTGYQMRSTDNGYTWIGKRDSIPAYRGELAPSLRGRAGGEVAISPDSLLGAIKNQPVILPRGFKCKNGDVLACDRIIAPTSKETAPGSKTEKGQWRCYMEISEDNANSWWITDKIPQDDARFRTIQPTILVHKDGRLQLLARTAAPKTPEQKEDALVATSWSDDGGLTWSQMEFISDLPNNNSGIDAVTLPDGTFAVVYNPFGCVDWRKPDDPKRNKPLRTPLWVATSKDGIHWIPTCQLETSPIGQYSYPTMIVGSDGTLHCVYTWRRERIKYKRFENH